MKQSYIYIIIIIIKCEQRSTCTFKIALIYEGQIYSGYKQ